VPAGGQRFGGEKTNREGGQSKEDETNCGRNSRENQGARFPRCKKKQKKSNERV